MSNLNVDHIAPSTPGGTVDFSGPNLPTFGGSAIGFGRKPSNPVVNTDYLLRASDLGKVVQVSNISTVTLTVPATSREPGFSCEILAEGPGLLNIVPSPGVTFIGSTLTSLIPESHVTLFEKSPNVFVVSLGNSEVQADLSSTDVGRGASKVGVSDVGNYFTGTDAEAALQELAISRVGMTAAIAAVEAGQATGVIGYSTKALLDADLAHIAGTVGYVTNDPTVVNNGTYLKTGGSGSGSWTKAVSTVFDLALDKRGTLTQDVLPWGVKDALDNVALGLDTDGTLIAKLPISVSGVGADNGLSLTRGVDGKYSLSLGTKSGNIVLPGTELISHSAESDAMFAVTDAAGNVAFSIDRLGNFQAELPLTTELPGANLAEALESDAIFALSDSAGNLSFVVTRTGEVVIPSLAVGTAKIDPTVRRGDATLPNLVDINHFMVSGQSLSVGGSSASIVDSTDLMLSTGLHAAIGSTNTLVPLSNTGGEGILLAAIGQMKFLCAGNTTYSSDPAFNSDFKVLVSGHGVSGSAIALLAKGGSTGAFETGIHQVEEAVRLSSASGVAVEVPAISWFQGESDRDTPVATYKAALLQLKSDYNTDILSRTGQPNRIPLVCYQTSSEQFFTTVGIENEPHAAAAVLEASETDPEIVVSAPTYWVPHVDGVHFTGDNYKLFGQMHGKVLYKMFYRGETWKPLSPSTIKAPSPKVIICKFNVPEPPLVFDTTTVTNPGNYGFEVRDSVGVVPISEVAIINKNTVRISVSRNLASTPQLSYAWYSIGGTLGGPTTGPRGCLRDSDTTVGAFDGAVLHNWCVRFKKSII